MHRITGSAILVVMKAYAIILFIPLIRIVRDIFG
jgi:hypothetical protein